MDEYKHNILKQNNLTRLLTDYSKSTIVLFDTGRESLSIKFIIVFCLVEMGNCLNEITMVITILTIGKIKM